MSGMQVLSRSRQSIMTSGACVLPSSCTRPLPQTRAATIVTRYAVVTARVPGAPHQLSHLSHHHPHHGPWMVRRAGHASYYRWTVAMPASRGAAQAKMGLPAYPRSAPPSLAQATWPPWGSVSRGPQLKHPPDLAAHTSGPAMPLAETTAWMRRRMRSFMNSCATIRTLTTPHPSLHAIARVHTHTPTCASSGSSGAGSTAIPGHMLHPLPHLGLTRAQCVRPCAVVTVLTAHPTPTQVMTWLPLRRLPSLPSRRSPAVAALAQAYALGPLDRCWTSWQPAWRTDSSHHI